MHDIHHQIDIAQLKTLNAHTPVGISRFTELHTVCFDISCAAALRYEQTYQMYRLYRTP